MYVADIHLWLYKYENIKNINYNVDFSDFIPDLLLNLDLNAISKFEKLVKKTMPQATQSSALYIQGANPLRNINDMKYVTQ